MEGAGDGDQMGRLSGLMDPPKEDKGFIGNLMKNPIFGAGAGVAGMGVAFALFRQGMLQGSIMLQRQLTVSLEIPSKVCMCVCMFVC
jgi:hypothetical protein